LGKQPFFLNRSEIYQLLVIVTTLQPRATTTGFGLTILWHGRQTVRNTFMKTQDSILLA